MGQQDTLDAYRRYRTGLTINLAVVAIQAFVWILVARAVGLLEDTAHGIGDNIILIGATIVLYFETHGAAPNKGRRRILALIAGVLLILGGIVGGYLAHGRITGVQIPLAGTVIAITSLIAIIGNGWAFMTIHGINPTQHDRMHKANVSHLLGDLLISTAVFFSALGIIYFDLPAIDSYVALLAIAPWMILRGIDILKYKDPPEDEHGGELQHHHRGHHH